MAIITFLVSAIKFGMVLLFGSTGETVTEKSGHLNLGLPGVMCVGTACGCVAEAIFLMFIGFYNAFVALFTTKNINMVNEIKANPTLIALVVIVPIVATLVGSALMGLLFSFLTVTLHANQNVTGLAMTTLGIGVSKFMINTIQKKQLSFSMGAKFFSGEFPFAKSLVKNIDKIFDSIGLDKLGISISEIGTKISDINPEVGIIAWLFDEIGWFVNQIGWIVGNLAKAIETLFFNYDIMLYLAIVTAIVTAIVLTKTRVGLHLRSVGENPATADAAGINVIKYRYLATCTGCAIAGLGGLMFIMDYLNGNWEYIIDSIGWLCVALVIFTTWKPIPGIFCSLLFGAFYVAAEYIPGISLAAKEIFKMLPYLITIAVLIMTSIRNKKEDQPPTSLGLPYFREDR